MHGESDRKKKETRESGGEERKSEYIYVVREKINQLKMFSTGIYNRTQPS